MNMNAMPEYPYIRLYGEYHQEFSKHVGATCAGNDPAGTAPYKRRSGMIEAECGRRGLAVGECGLRPVAVRARAGAFASLRPAAAPEAVS